MPQSHRKVAFSAKKKRNQLQQKRANKNPDGHGERAAMQSCQILSGQRSPVGAFNQDVQVINHQPSSSSTYNQNRYNLTFKKETTRNVKEMLARSMQPLNFLPQEKLEVSHEEIFATGSDLDMPKRPLWKQGVSKLVLEAQEEKYFREYVQTIETKFEDSLCHFDMNLENWRQLWRVVEFSDIVLLVTDIRYPVFHFSPALYNHVTKDLKKEMIVVFNKIDLVEPHVVVAWKDYFQKCFPKLHLMYFASYAGMKIKQGKRGRRIGKLHMAVEGSRHLMELCQTIVNGQVDLSSWQEKIHEEAAQVNYSKEGSATMASDDDDDDDHDDNGFNALKNANIITCQNDTSYYEEGCYRDGVLTIGFVGHPNVGKSSFLNAVLGKKVVSVSRTPGHTKHYQTIMLTPTVRLCDCPGLVFPSLLPKPMQVLIGCYPIAQVREPYSIVGFLSVRVPVHKILRLQHPEFDSKRPHEEHVWSAYDICAAFAEKRGFHLARSSRPDVYRAANNILRMVLDGRTICLAFYPPGFFQSLDIWLHQPEVKNVRVVQAHRQGDLLDYDGQDIPADRPSAAKPQSSTSTSSDEQSDEDLPSTASNKFSLLSVDV